MPIVYTHDFEMKVGTHTIEGELEFNEDGKMTVKFNDLLVGISSEQMRSLTNFLERMKELFDLFGSLKKVEITEK